MWRLHAPWVVAIGRCCLAQAALADPSIEILEVPACGQLGVLRGRVTGVTDFSDYEVATYIQPEGVGWWTKPTMDGPTVPVDPSGHFEVDVTTGGLASADPWATLYAVNLLAAGGTAPQAMGLCHLPESPLFLATDTQERYCSSLDFSGRTWGVKVSPVPVGPGPNRFSSGPDSVRVDPDGKLHLAIVPRDNEWYSAEVIATESLGYGRYLIQTSSRVDEIRASSVFGAFLWDAYGEPGLGEGRCNREVDFEDAVWDSPSTGDTQFVVQPWDLPQNLHRFWLPDLKRRSRG